MRSLYEEAKRGEFDQVLWTLAHCTRSDSQPVGVAKSTMIVGFQEGTSGGTFLHQAARHGDVEACRKLVEEYRANATVLDARGEAPAATAARQGHAECAAAIDGWVVLQQRPAGPEAQKIEAASHSGWKTLNFSRGARS